MKNLREILMSLNACDNALNWVGRMAIEDAVKDCSRGDWMLWMAQCIGVDNRQLTLAAARCAETVSGLMKPKGKLFLEIAMQYGIGKIGEKEMIEEWRKIDSLNTLCNDADMAARFCCPHCCPIYEAAAYAARAKVRAKSNGYDNMIFINYQSQVETSNICRDIIGKLIIDKVNEMLQ